MWKVKIKVGQKKLIFKKIKECNKFFLIIKRNSSKIYWIKEQVKKQKKKNVTNVITNQREGERTEKGWYSKKG